MAGAHHPSRLAACSGSRLRMTSRGGLLLRLGREEQRIAPLPAELGRLLRLGLGDVAGIDRDHAHPALMRRQHHVIGALAAHAEDGFEHLDDEFARRVVVVQQNHLVERRALGFGARLGARFRPRRDDRGAHRGFYSRWSGQCCGVSLPLAGRAAASETSGRVGGFHKR